MKFHKVEKIQNTQYCKVIQFFSFCLVNLDGLFVSQVAESCDKLRLHDQLIAVDDYVIAQDREEAEKCLHTTNNAIRLRLARHLVGPIRRQLELLAYSD